MPFQPSWAHCARAAAAALAITLLAIAPRTTSRAAEARDDDVDSLFLPFRTDRAALSWDGRYLAYSVREDGVLKIIISDVDNPDVNTGLVVAEEKAEPGEREKTPVNLHVLHWTPSNRLVFSLDQPWQISSGLGRVGRFRGAVYSTGPDGKDARLLAGPLEVAYQPSLPDAEAGTVRAGVVILLPPPQPRSLRVVALPLDQPNTVIIEGGSAGGDSAGAVQQASESLVDDAEDAAQDRPGAGGKDALSRTGLFRLNVDTGKIAPIEEITEALWEGEFLYDHQGVLRGAINVKNQREDFYYAPRRGGVPRPLDAWLGPEAKLAFHRTPENQLGERSFPLGFDVDPQVLYFASNLGRPTYGIYALNLATKQRAALAIENDDVDLADLNRPLDASSLVFDRHRRALAGVRYLDTKPRAQWLDPDIAEVQAQMDRQFSARAMEILDWNEARTRFLVLTSSGSDPGRYYIWHRDEGRFVEFVRRAPWVNTSTAHPSAPFEFRTPAGVRLTGFITRPRQSRLNPPPLVVWLHDGPWSRDLPGYDAEAQVIAAMGFTVVRVNYRGSSGFGRAMREALCEAPDRGPVEDVIATLDWLAPRKFFEPKRVAIAGRGFGGYLALRALQLHPERFRAGVAIDAPTDLNRWIAGMAIGGFDSELSPSSTTLQPFRMTGPEIARITYAQRSAALEAAVRREMLGSDRERLRELSPATHPELITKPVFFGQQSEQFDLAVDHTNAFRRALERRDVPVEIATTSGDYVRGVPGARARFFGQLEGFLNLHLYDFKVERGTLERINVIEEDEQEEEPDPAYVPPTVIPAPVIPLDAP